MTKKILIADDAAVVRLVLKDLLESAGFEVVGECENGEEAVANYKDLQPDLVTMDITMPVKDGLTALEEILGYDRKARIVMITAVDDKSALTRAIKAGATDYIVKPFEEDRVLGAVKSAFGAEGEATQKAA